jgi:hypothetical protein
MMEVSAFEMRLWREELFPGKGMGGKGFGANRNGTKQR